MKNGSKFLLMIGIIFSLISSVVYYYYTDYQKKVSSEETDMKLVLSKNYEYTAKATKDSVKPLIKDVKRIEVYDHLTMKELSNKINKSLNSTLSNKGDVIAKYAIKYNVDPYLATAIILHETGCKWSCSYLVNACNNVGGIKGSNTCGGGAYAGFSTLDEGIKYFMKNLYNNYYARGLNTPEELKPTYAGNSENWDISIRNYISEIKAK